MEIKIYDPCTNWGLLQTYEELSVGVRKRLNIPLSVSAKCDVKEVNALYIWQEEPSCYPIEAGARYVYGSRVLNRFERLCIAEECGCRLPLFFEATDERAVQAYVTDKRAFVLKQDQSARGTGVFLLNRYMHGEGTVPALRDGDVIMEFIEGCGSTWKLDCFYTTALSCRITNDNPLNPIRRNEGFKLAAMPPVLRCVPASLGLKLERFGCLYYSVDLMLLRQEFAIIEINSSGVGRLDQWAQYRSLYVDGFINGLSELSRAPLGRKLTDITSAVSRWKGHLAMRHLVDPQSS